MYARSTTFHGRPEKVEAAIAFVENEAWPMLEEIEGCRGLSLLVDRQSGQCITTSSWESEETMRASDDRMRPFRERGRDILGGSMEMDEWEIAVMHRTHHGECCRVSWLQGNLASISDSFRAGILPQLEEMSGFCSASLLLNWVTGLCCITSTWESRGAMEASRAAADNLRNRAVNEADGEIGDVHEFELAHAHLHVPEMA